MRGSIPKTLALHGSMPNQEYYFYLLRALDFEPKYLGDKNEIRRIHGKY